MLNTSRFPLQRRAEQHARRTRVIHKETWKPSHRSFQWKYTGFLVAAVFGATAMFMGVAYYQLQQNYDIFNKLAFDSSPELVAHLEREMQQFTLFFISTLVSIFALCLLIGLRFTGNVIKPLIQIERHMKKVTQGDWSSPDFVYRSDDDLIDLLVTYSYLYRSLRAHTETEIKMLEKLDIDPDNRESMTLWTTLIQQKKSQLNLAKPLSTAEAGAETSLPPGSRRAS